MRYLHNATPPLIHRDLKSPNTLLASTDSDAVVCAKVADFGLSQVSVLKARGRTVHNPAWLAPEVFVETNEYTHKVDVYSYGVLLWELASLHYSLPFAEYKERFAFDYEMEDSIVHESLRPTVPADCPPLYRRLMEECWQHDPELRPEFDDILHRLEHEVVPDIVPDLFLPNELSFSQIVSPRNVELSPPAPRNRGTRRRAKKQQRTQKDTAAAAHTGGSGCDDDDDVAADDEASTDDPRQERRRRRRHKKKGSASSPSTSSKMNADGGEDLLDAVRLRHKAAVHCALSVSARVLVGLEDGRIATWEVSTREQLTRPLHAHQGAVHALLLLQNGCVLSAGADRMLLMWKPDLGSGRGSGAAEAAERVSPEVSVRCSRAPLHLEQAGEMLWCANSKGITLRDRNTLKLRKTLPRDHEVTALLAVGTHMWCASNTLLLYDATTFKRVGVVECSAPVVALAYAGDMVAASTEQDIHLYSLHGVLRSRVSLQAGSDMPIALLLAAKERQLWCGFGDGTLQVWELEADVQSPQPEDAPLAQSLSRSRGQVVTLKAHLRLTKTCHANSVVALVIVSNERTHEVWSASLDRTIQQHSTTLCSKRKTKK
jgi:Protein tyrosine and serine/threonine kinase